MQGNDLASFAPISQATMFEGVLASEPEGLSKVRSRVALTTKNWEQYISFWKVNEIPVKHAIDLINRYNVGVVVYTLLPDYLVDSIEKWLIRKGISTTVTAYKSIEELAYDLRFFPSIQKVYIANEEHAKIIGFRSTVVTPKTAWSA